jgi:predicted enzyme related to lactoylglutathione lyase
MTKHKTGTREEWLAARLELLKDEKELTRRSDEVARKFEGGPIEYWLITTGEDKDPGINGGMTRPREGQSPGTLNTVAVESLDQTIKKIEQRGGKICVPKMAIPKIGWLAYAEDPAGNVFGIIEPNAEAK